VHRKGIDKLRNPTLQSACYLASGVESSRPSVRGIMTAAPPPRPGAGWYPDPHGSGQQRYFDGTNWGPTAPPPQYSALASSAPPPPSGDRRFTIHYGFVLLAIFSLLGTVIPTIFWFGSAASVEEGNTQSEQEAADAATGFLGIMGVGWLLWGGMWTIIWTAFAIQHTLKSRRS